MATFFLDDMSRRQFVAASLATLSMLPGSASASVQARPTVQELIDLILKQIPGSVPNTVDTIKIGDPDQTVRGVVTSMFPTIEVIRKTIDLNANFLIVHEPSFYNHTDETTWLENDDVYQFKKQLLTKNKIAIWRFHDYIHRHSPDGVLEGVIQKLGWKKFQDTSRPQLITFAAPRLLRVILADVKDALGIEYVRIVGDSNDQCQRVLFLPGASGGRAQIAQIMNVKPDLIFCGEVAEWETSEYIRDARAMGLKRSLVVLGHAQSEEPGMSWLVDFLKEKVPQVKATHIPSNNPFTFL
ncbi:MAG TPA: Nif3-like dinuclear metal center hexameric protein [Chryseosolibacter sp.]